jgi:hypothetical protein
MNSEHRCSHRALPGWLVAVIVFASGLVIGQTLAQIAVKTGLL